VLKTGSGLGEKKYSDNLLTVTGFLDDMPVFQVCAVIALTGDGQVHRKSGHGYDKSVSGSFHLPHTTLVQKTLKTKTGNSGYPEIFERIGMLFWEKPGKL
jgi:hypothetical protein